MDDQDISKTSFRKLAGVWFQRGDLDYTLEDLRMALQIMVGSWIGTLIQYSDLDNDQIKRQIESCFVALDGQDVQAGPLVKKAVLNVCRNMVSLRGQVLSAHMAASAGRPGNWEFGEIKL